MDIRNLTALETGRLIKEGKLTSVDATKAVLDSIAATDKDINAYITVIADAALKRAAEVDADFIRVICVPAPDDLDISVEDEQNRRENQGEGEHGV